MALGATVHRFQIDLSDVDRGVYEALDLRVARHPSESVPYLLTRTLAARAIWLVWRQGHSRELLEGRLGRLLVVLIVLCSGAELVLWVLRWFGMFGGPVPV